MSVISSCTRASSRFRVIPPVSHDLRLGAQLGGLQPQGTERVCGKPLSACRLVGGRLRLRFEAEVGDLGEKLVDPYANTIAFETGGQLEKPESSRLQPAGAYQPCPVGGDLGVTLPRKELECQLRAEWGAATEKRTRRDRVMVEQVVTHLVAGDEPQFVRLESLEQGR